MYRQDSYCEYLLTFASFYKSMYAKDQLRSSGIIAVPQRVPAGIFKTCSQGIHVSHCDIEEVLEILHKRQADPTRIYEIRFSNGEQEYQQI